MNTPLVLSNSSINVPELENIEPDIQQHMGRIFTADEAGFIEKLWNNHFLYLLKEKYMSKYFVVPAQKFSDIQALDTDLFVKIFPYIFYHSLKKSVVSEIYPLLTPFKLKLIANSTPIPYWFLSGNLNGTSQSCNLDYINQIISTLSQAINPLGIASNTGDIIFNENTKNSSYCSFLGLSFSSENVPVEKNDIVYLVGDKETEPGITWEQEDLNSNLFYQIRVFQFSQELNKHKLILKQGFPVHKSIYSSAFALAHRLQKGIHLDCKDELKSTNQIFLISNPGSEMEITEFADKWGLHIQLAGKIASDNHFKVNSGNAHIDIPVSIFNILLKKIELKNNEIKPPKNHNNHINFEKYKEPGDYRDTAWNLLSNENLISRNWITSKFDSTIGTGLINNNFPATAHLINQKGTNKAVAVSSISRQDIYHLDPEKGAHLAVADITRKITCCGGIPKVLTPTFAICTKPDMEHPHLQKIIKGLYTAARYFQLQVTEPAIFFIDPKEDDSKPVHTFLYCTGIIPDKNHLMTIAFKNKGDMIYLIGKSKNDINSSLYLRNNFIVRHSDLPDYDIQEELNLQDITRKLLKNNSIRSANTVSMGGLFKTLIDSAIIREHGFDITSDAEIRKDAFLFGESPTRIVVTVTAHHETEFIDFMVNSEIPFSALGHVTKEEIRVDDISYGFISDFQKEYFTSPK